MNILGMSGLMMKPQLIPRRWRKLWNPTAISGEPNGHETTNQSETHNRRVASQLIEALGFVDQAWANRTAVLMTGDKSRIKLFSHSQKAVYDKSMF